MTAKNSGGINSMKKSCGGNDFCLDCHKFTQYGFRSERRMPPLESHPETITEAKDSATCANGYIKAGGRGRGHSYFACRTCLFIRETVEHDC